MARPSQSYMLIAGLFIGIAMPLTLMSASSAEAQTSTHRYYNQRGHFQGQTQTRGNTARSYDNRGHHTGTAQTRGNTTRFYDNRGRHTGTVTRRR